MIFQVCQQGIRIELDNRLITSGKTICQDINCSKNRLNVEHLLETIAGEKI